MSRPQQDGKIALPFTQGTLDLLIGAQKTSTLPNLFKVSTWLKLAPSSLAPNIKLLQLLYKTLWLVGHMKCLLQIMENVRQVVVPIVAKCIHENICYLYVSFLSHFSIKIVCRKMVILSSLSQKLVTGFFPLVNFMTDAKILLSATLPHSHTLFLCLSHCLPVSPSFRPSINIMRVCNLG